MTNDKTSDSAVVFAGAGDLAQRAIADLQAMSEPCAITTIARRDKGISGVCAIKGDLKSADTLAALAAQNPRVIVVTLVPNGRGEQGYEQGYIEPLSALLLYLQQQNLTPTIIFASSTGVYHQVEGEWVDELTQTNPANFSGQCMLNAEQMLAKSGLTYCNVRFGGIYGPGRDFLIRQVQAGNGGGPDYTNRIHQQDAGRLLSFLVQRSLQGKSIPQTLLACDCEPERSNVVRQFIATQLNIPVHTLSPSPSGRGGNKRCANKALLALGFVLNYPTYKKGYKLS